MPSLTDVANQVNNTLSSIDTNTSQTAALAGQIKADTTDIKTKLDTINKTIHDGMSLLAHGLFAIDENIKQTNSLLAENSAENKTMICWLSEIADLLCRQIRKMNVEIALETEMRDDLRSIESTLELVHAREALEAKRLADLKAEVEKCCPPPPPVLETCPEPCVLREVPIYHPLGQEWKPQFPK